VSPDAIECSEVGCPHVAPNHRWGKIRAAEQGWFFMKGGSAWCPIHRPEWYEAWIAGRKK